MKKPWKYGTMILILIAVTVWICVLRQSDANLHIVACDVGQGDGLLLFKGQTQIIIDGGPNNSIQKCLDKYVPFWDREIEMVILTNPDFDHYFGLIELVKRYKIDLFVLNDIQKEGEEYKALTDLIKEKKIKALNPLTGTKIKIGSIILDYVWPARIENRSINELSLVFNLKYGEFDALFTGDVVPQSIDEVLETGKIYDIDYLKVPHHGSKNGLTKQLLDASNPEIAVISDGRKNRYGHPSKEIIDMLESAHVPIHRTDLEGNIEVVTDGKKWWVEN